MSRLVTSSEIEAKSFGFDYGNK